jgi:hypothetical protein
MSDNVCTHSMADQDTAIFDGKCPLCLADENARLKFIISSGEKVVSGAAAQAEARLHAEVEAEKLRTKLTQAQEERENVRRRYRELTSLIEQGVGASLSHDERKARIEQMQSELQAANTALIAVREWLWSGKLQPGQKPGAPINAPESVTVLVNAALDNIDETERNS